MTQDEELHEILESHFSKLTSDLEEYMKKHEDDVAAERTNFYTPQIDDITQRIRQGEDDFAGLHANVSELTEKLVKKEAILNKMVRLSAKLHRKVRNTNSCARSFNFWTEIGTNKDILAKTYRTIFITNSLKRLMFRRWLRKMYRKRENRIMKEVKTRFDKEARAKAAESSRVIEGVEQELAAAKAELEEKQKKFIDMQQRLRKAFMRGVVNLNLEAMDVFNGAQYMDLIHEVEGNQAEHRDQDAPLDESDDEFFVEEAPQISVIKHH